MPLRTALLAAHLQAELAQIWPELSIVAKAADGVQAFELQAVDYLLKPLARIRLQQCCQRLQQQLAQRDSSHHVGGQDLQTVAHQLHALLGAAGLVPLSAAAPHLEFITAQTGSLVEVVSIEEVVYFEAADKYVRVLTADREHLIRMSLRELITQVDERRFWQIHRSILVQARCISRAVRDEQGRMSVRLRQRGEVLPVSRIYAQLFKGI